MVQLPQGEPRAADHRRLPSKLGDIQPDHWLAEYTTELINVLNVLGQLVDLEQAQAELLERTCTAQTISADELREAGALAMEADLERRNAGSGLLEQASPLD